MAAHVDYPQFQAGLAGLARPPFMPGMPSLGPRSRATTRPTTNNRHHKQYNVLPMLKDMYGTEWLHKQFLFNFGFGGSYGIDAELVNNMTSSYAKKRKRIIDANDIWDTNVGGPMGENVIAVHLPFVNYLLTTICNEYDGEGQFQTTGVNVLNNEYFYQWLIPPINDIIDYFTPIGVNVTNIEADVTRQGTIGPFTKAFCIEGPADCLDLFGCTDYVSSEYNEFKRLRPLTQVGFVCRPVDLEKEGLVGSVFKFNLSKTAYENVSYRKRVVWKMEPYIFIDNETVLKDTMRFTVKKELEIEDGKGLNVLDDSEKMEYKVKTLIYKPYFYKVGYLGGPATGGDGTPMSYINMKKDPCYDWQQSQTLPIIELFVQMQGGWIKPL